MVKVVYDDKLEVTEFRKISKSGSSFIITIPSIWLKQNKLNRGDDLKCIITKDKIIITNKTWEEEHKDISNRKI
jgi:antitoxin component of MazEF toxin-antitoxin module